MQLDMHFYGTYALARAAGIPQEDAYTIAYAAQYVDDSTKQDSKQHEDGGLLYGIATSHDGGQCVLNYHKDVHGSREEQRRVWVPFHFLPGAEGKDFEEQLLCKKNSKPAQEMMQNHLRLAAEKPYGLELLGIAAHVYMDTFSHFGFSGVSSSLNKIIDGSIKPLELKDPKMADYVLSKLGRFIKRYKLGSVISFFAEESTGSLGHGAVATFPDRPYLKWCFEYEYPHESTTSSIPIEAEQIEVRDNKVHFFEGCELLYHYFRGFAGARYPEPDVIPFEDIADDIKEIITTEDDCHGRIDKWRALSWKNTPVISQKIRYNKSDWENQKFDFDDSEESKHNISSNVYRFHQAAAYHRYYVLKDLLPAHGIAAY
ncbi:DUF6765 family protein [Halodesulfovibrio sp.]|jgi:hypothetical protein|uniref:DUF6765 family protein n=1 Tax=Halodesulfovibrio sp. TaxID=1912772 RepID=UPI0025E8D9DB|nr:DUF6765 family protein [Halodesulfovibrio sp.]MCT4535141.1 hypothetical protein [Halodesulfovibrio sp.]